MLRGMWEFEFEDRDKDLLPCIARTRVNLSDVDVSRGISNLVHRSWN